jgi:hypothetical protein
MTPSPINRSSTGIATLKPSATTLVKRITEVLRRREAEPHPIPLPRVATLPPKIIQKMVKAILMNGHEVVGSSLTKKTPLDIDVHVPGLRFKFVEVHANIMESLSHIEYDAYRVQSTIEKTNVLYGEKIDCRYIVTITLYQENGVEKEIMIDLTDGTFDPPVYITNTVKAEKMQVVFNKQPSGTNWEFNRGMQKFNFAALSHQAYRNTFTTVLVPDYNCTRPITTLERVMEMQRADRSEVNPQSVLFGYDMVASLDAIRRINDTNKKKKFLGGVDYKQTVETIISKENLCEPDWCSCNQGAGHIYQHGSIERTFVTLQCCGTTVCADLLTNNLKATYKAQFCPFSGPEGPHFMQFMHNSLLEPRNKILMNRLNRYWESTERESDILAARDKEDEDKNDRDPNVGPHGAGCSCTWPGRNRGRGRNHRYARGNYDDDSDVPLIDDHFEDDSSSDEMPEIAWEDEETDPPLLAPTTLERLCSPNPDENKLKDSSVFPTLGEAVVMEGKQIEANLNTVFVPVPVSIDYTRTMTPHCSTPGCKRCMYKMKCFQTWASSLTVTYGPPLYSFAMMLPAHMALNL